MFLVLDYAEAGQLIDWCENDNKFYLRREYQDSFLPENYLRKLFRDIVKGLHYCKIIKKISILSLKKCIIME